MTREWKNFSQEVLGGEAFRLFCDQFRSGLEGQKIRIVRLIGRRCSPEIFNTFLGYEIIAAGKRIICPDMTTARYIQIFAEIGLKEVAIPYDVTRTQEILPNLERAFASLKLILNFFTDQLLSKAEKSQFLKSVYSSLRLALVALSPSDGLKSGVRFGGPATLE